METNFEQWLDQQPIIEARDDGQGYQISHDYVLPDAATLRVCSPYQSFSEAAYDARGLRAGDNHTIRVTYRGVILAYAAPHSNLEWAVPHELKAKTIREDILKEKETF